MTEIRKFSIFQSFYAILVKFSIDYVDWRVSMGQQGNNLLSSSLFRRVYSSFWTEKSLKLAPKMTKNPKFQLLRSLYIFLSNFRRTPWIGMLERVNKETVCCPVGFRRVWCNFRTEKISNWHRELQKTELFPIFEVFLQFLANFRQTPWIRMLKTSLKVRIRCQ